MLRCWCVLVVGALWPGVAGAQAITFDEALSLTEASPEQRARERELQARARGDAEISEIITSPLRIDAQPGVRMLVQESSGFEGQLTVQQAWSLADLGGARRRTARHERDALAAQARAVALEARLGAAHAWLALRATEEALELARAEAALAHELAERAERSAGAGVLTAADAADAAAFAAEAELRALAIEGTAVQARVALARETAREASHDLRTEGGHSRQCDRDEREGGALGDTRCRSGCGLFNRRTRNRRSEPPGDRRHTRVHGDGHPCRHRHVVHAQQVA